MPIKNLLLRFQPAPLYIVLILSICYFSVQLILSHLTHALTLLMASYHMLCNIFALAGSIITIKHNELHNEQELSSPLLTKETQKHILSITHPDDPNIPKYPPISSPEFKTRNTFGWARIEILSMLVVCITLASLSFSLLVEALQTLVHIDHQDSMHLPFYVMILGFVGLLLNFFTYFAIGGYTLHQGSFLHINPTDGKVVVEPSNITIDSDANILSITNDVKNDMQLKEDLKTELGKVHYRARREGPTELLRDVSSTIFVIVCAVIVHFADDKEHTAKFIDPVLSIFSCVLVVALSYPYMKEACLILLQTIPGNIDMDNFESTLVKKFPQIVSYHDLHIWQLSSHKYIATVHIIFENPKMYEKILDDVRQHFHDHSITNVTIQPEFHSENTTNSSSECLVQCTRPECLDKVCCKDSLTDLREVSVCSSSDGHEHHEHEHEHGKKSCGKSKKQKDHHGHGHSHAHKHHGHSHGHSHNKHDHCDHDKHSHNHKVQAKEVQEVPKENTTNSNTQCAALATETEKTDATNSIPATLEENGENLAETSANGETSTNTLKAEKTEIAQLSPVQDSQQPPASKVVEADGPTEVVQFLKIRTNLNR
ncbi:Zinc transporter 10 [Lucilia cuprina]|nr:Zinc transporter 10 [Lucilia cuprina]